MIIESIDDPKIFEFLSLRNNRLEKGQMIAESPRVVQKAIETNRKIYKIFCTPEFKLENNQLLAPFDTITYTAKKELMQEIVGFKLHHGIMALIDQPNFVEQSELDDKILILNGLSSPENIGTLIRTAASFNIRSIIIDTKTCSPYMRRCVRVSMGNIFFVKVHLTHDLKETITSLKNDNYEVLSAANEENASSIHKYKFIEKTAVIIGSEGHGIDQEILDCSSQIIKIDIEDDVAHINAASAGSIFLYKLSLI